jgi:hypothetical protein
MKTDWIWMPHASHLCVAHKCRFHLNTYVNGYIVSTVGEYFPEEEVRRIFLKNRIVFPKLKIDITGKIQTDHLVTNEQVQEILSLKGDYFDAAYLRFFGFEDLGLNRKYETMVFRASKRDDPTAQCCPWEATGDCLESAGYNEPKNAFDGHMRFCEKWDNVDENV